MLSVLVRSPLVSHVSTDQFPRPSVKNAHKLRSAGPLSITKTLGHKALVTKMLDSQVEHLFLSSSDETKERTSLP